MVVFWSFLLFIKTFCVILPELIWTQLHKSLGIKNLTDTVAEKLNEFPRETSGAIVVGQPRFFLVFILFFRPLSIFPTLGLITVKSSPTWPLSSPLCTVFTPVKSRLPALSSQLELVLRAINSRHFWLGSNTVRQLTGRLGGILGSVFSPNSDMTI